MQLCDLAYSSEYQKAFNGLRRATRRIFLSWIWNNISSSSSSPVVRLNRIAPTVAPANLLFLPRAPSSLPAHSLKLQAQSPPDSEVGGQRSLWISPKSHLLFSNSSLFCIVFTIIFISFLLPFSIPHCLSLTDRFRYLKIDWQI